MKGGEAGGPTCRRRGLRPSQRSRALPHRADDLFNHSDLAAVVGACLTSPLKWESIPGNVRVGNDDKGLPTPSLVNVTKILVVDKSLLRDRAGAPSAVNLMVVDEGESSRVVARSPQRRLRPDGHVLARRLGLRVLRPVLQEARDEVLLGSTR